MLASRLRYAAWRATARAACWSSRMGVSQTECCRSLDDLGCCEVEGEGVRFGVEGKGRLGSTHLFLVVQALVVIFEHGLALHFALVVFGRGVGDVAGEDFLPEGEAARRACQWEIPTCQSMVLLTEEKARDRRQQRAGFGEL